MWLVTWMSTLLWPMYRSWDNFRSCFFPSPWLQEIEHSPWCWIACTFNISPSQIINIYLSNNWSKPCYNQLMVTLSVKASLKLPWDFKIEKKSPKVSLQYLFHWNQIAVHSCDSQNWVGGGHKRGCYLDDIQTL